MGACRHVAAAAMFDEEPIQLSFDVGGGTPDFASVKVSGAMRLSRQLRKGEEVSIRLISPDGEIIAEADGHVSSVAFKDKRNKFGDVESTERAHTVKAV